MKQYHLLTNTKMDRNTEDLLSELEACSGHPIERSANLIYTADDAIFEGVA